MNRSEHKVSALVHLVGAALALGGLPVLVVVAALEGTARHVVTFTIFGSTLVFLYLCSALYHAVEGPAKPILKKMDCIAIFWLIAGTYTPICLVTLKGPLGWTLVGVNGGLAVAGTVNEALAWKYHRAVSHALYLAMGWLALPAVAPVVKGLGGMGFALIVAGGFFYTGGLVFYAWKRVPHSHGIWHAFVLAGSVCHFLSVILFVR
jgi:hemolysin III